MAEYRRQVRVGLPVDSVTEQTYEDYVLRVMDALERMGHTDVHVSASLRDKFFHVVMDVEAPTAADAQAHFAQIVAGAVKYARREVLESESNDRFATHTPCP